MRENGSMLPARDTELVQIVDRALADATARGGSWLACRPGCTPCCHGVFRISPLDAERLRAGWRDLQDHAPERAEPMLARARVEVARLWAEFPGDPATGFLGEEDELWEHFADLPEAPCPVLDPETGRCELYSARPLTCRAFGPPVQSEGGIGLCELCYVGAKQEDILAGELHLEHIALEAELDAELAASGQSKETVIAWALVQSHC